MNCKNCGNPIEEGASSCPFCGQAVLEEQAADLTSPKCENRITGTVGAFMGALIGGALIILLSQIGYVASISGLVLAVCTLKGYELLGRKLSKPGIIICLALILITPYLADRLDWAIMLKESWGDVTLGEAFAVVPKLVAADAEIRAEYIKCLAMLYLFAFMGAYGTLRDLFKK